jgi:hypothetical protein
MKRALAVLGAHHGAEAVRVKHRHPRRAALLAGVSLGAVAALGFGEARAQQGPFLYVPGGVGDVSVVDTSNTSVVGGPIPVAGTPIAAAVSGDGAFAYIVNGLANTVVPIVVAPQRSDMFSRFEREAMNSRGER